MMAASQIALYRREWGQARKVLRSRGLPPDQADCQRHQIHIAQLGHDKSSTLLTNSEFDKILAAFRAISTPPEDLNGVLESERHGAVKLRATIRLLQCAMDKPDAYLVGIISRMNSAGRIAQPPAQNRADAFDYAHLQDGAPARRNLILEDLSEAELIKVLLALKIQSRRIWKTKAEILATIREFSREFDLDERTANDTALAALGWQELPPLERCKYEHLVIIFGAIRPLASSDQPF